MQAFAQEQPPANAPETAEQAVNLDPAFVWSKVESWVVGFQKLLPNIVVALVLFALFWGAAWAVNRSIHAWAHRRERDDLGDVLGTSIRWAIMAAGGMIALTVVIPSLNPRDLVAGLGIGSVAIGFAFKDILQNWLAGLLLLFNRPFRIGDQIVVNSFEGTVVKIATRATVIKTYDGRDIIVPNADIYSNAVTVNTAQETRSSSYDVGIGYKDSIEKARGVILEAVRDLDGVEKKPEPLVRVQDLAPSSVNLRVVWHTNSMRTDVVRTRATVLEAIKTALDAAEIDMPYQTQVLMLENKAGEENRAGEEEGPRVAESGRRAERRQGEPGGPQVSSRDRAH